MREAGRQAAQFKVKSKRKITKITKLTLEYGVSWSFLMELNLYLILLVNHERRHQRGLSTNIYL